MPNRSPCALEIPDPETLSLDDKALLETYRDFYSSLSREPGGDVIRCDGDFFCFSTSGGGIGPEHYPKLRLLSALMRPTDRLLRRLDKRVSTWANSWGDSSGFLAASRVHQALGEIEVFQHTADYRELTKGTIAPRHLDSLSSLFSNAPGMTWLSHVDIDTWSRNWGVILYYGDSEDDVVNNFPTILGFALRSNYPESAAKILSGEPAYTIPAEAEISGDDFLAACWVRHGEEQSESLGTTLLEFEDDSLRILTEEYSTLTSPILFDDIRTVEVFAEEYLDDDKTTLGLHGVFQKYGGIQENKGLKPLLKKLEQDEMKLELEESKAWEEERIAAQAAAESRYDAASCLRPEDLPPDMTVDQLTEDQHLSIKKWMQEELELSSCRLWYGRASKWGRPLSYYYFSIGYEDADGRKHKNFYKPFPTVRDAFDVAFAL